AAHGDADEGTFERRSVIDTVSDHADLLILCLTPVDKGKFVFRKAVGADFINLEFTGNIPGCIFMISGQQHRGNTGFFDSLNDGGSIFSQGIRESEEACQFSVNGSKYKGRAGFRVL